MNQSDSEKRQRSKETISKLLQEIEAEELASLPFA
jgi:hypothetical protein